MSFKTNALRKKSNFANSVWVTETLKNRRKCRKPSALGMLFVIESHWQNNARREHWLMSELCNRLSQAVIRNKNMIYLFEWMPGECHWLSATVRAQWQTHKRVVLWTRCHYYVKHGLIFSTFNVYIWRSASEKGSILLACDPHSVSAHLAFQLCLNHSID